MFLSRVQIFIAGITIHIILPFILLMSFLIFGKGNLTDNIILTFFVGNCLLLMLKTGFWEFTNYYVRYFIAIAFFIIEAVNLISLGQRESMQNIFTIGLHIHAILILLSLILLYFNINAYRGSVRPKNCINIAFPFKRGNYIITDGGDGKFSSLLNYHYKAQIHKEGQSNASMRYAVDIAKLNKYGFTVRNILVAENEQYEIFHEKVYSPCEAVVVKVVNGIKSNIPFSRKFPYNVGNCVVLKNENYYIVMGHLEENSITVSEGDKLKCGQLLGVIGNSGLTPRPHLHMQVSRCEDGFYWGGEGVPILFNDLKYPVKNKVIQV